MTEPKVKYKELTTGFEFTPSTFQMDADTVTAYKKATEDNNPVYAGKIVPAMAVAAIAMAAMADKFEVLPGTIHVSQQLDFLKAVYTGETLISYAGVKRKVERGSFNMLNITIRVENANRETVMTAETGFILPETKNG
jgi:acyl dehydratase